MFAQTIDLVYLCVYLISEGILTNIRIYANSFRWWLSRSIETINDRANPQPFNLSIDRDLTVMTRNKKPPQPLEIRKIQRDRVIIGLSLAAAVAVAIHITSDDNPDAQIEAVFYQNTAQCEADITRQQAEYAALLQQYQAGQLDEQPEPPPIQAADCGAQMLAAQQEHDRTAPVYNSIADCQAEGVQCEATPASVQQAGYRPIYGGTYIDIDDSRYTYINYGGNQHRIYAARTVYQSINPGRIVTPYGREIAQSATGRVSVPRHTTFAAPTRPTGTSGAGTIRGRSSQGFGSSFKSTGGGGK
jgi:uncharacterized protein YgiB involved in biofilm formation